MADGTRDNTNLGVFFDPRDNQKLVGSGNLDVGGKKRNIAIIREPINRDGRVELVLYAKVGVLFKADREKKTEKGPDYSGPLDLGENLRVAGWRGEKNDRRYCSLKVSEQQKREGGGNQGGDGKRLIPDDEIPF